MSGGAYSLNHSIRLLEKWGNTTRIVGNKLIVNPNTQKENILSIIDSWNGKAVLSKDLTPFIRN